MAFYTSENGVDGTKKIRMSRELSYILGIFIMPFSIAVMTKASLGLSMIAAPTYIVSEKIDWLTYGQAEYIAQALVLLLMCIVVKKFKILYLFSFVTAIIYGSILDIFIYLLRDFNPEAIVIRIALFIIGMILTSISVAFFFNTYLPPCAYDFFVREIVLVKKADMRKFKIGNDVVYLGVSLILSFALFGRLTGISAGTIIIVLVNGNLIAFINGWMNKRIEFYDRLPWAKYF